MIHLEYMDKEHVLVFFDVEATGIDAEDRLCQIAFKVSKGNANIESHYFKPPLPIKIGAMAVHHITEAMVADKPAFIGSDLHDRLRQYFEQDGHIFVAHNAKYDRDMMIKEGITPSTYIDTLKVAKHVFPTMESYSLQFLRYFFAMEIDAVAHDAKGDVLVLEQLFYRILTTMQNELGLSVEQAIERMLAWTQEPILVKYFTFGKHKNKSLEEVAKEDKGYLEWLLREKIKSGDTDEDWMYTLNYYLNQ